ncbi:hypothetical protein [Rubrobacter tropicus]|nr:hypothetical protein [Rubrobacter tropicus]
MSQTKGTANTASETRKTNVCVWERPAPSTPDTKPAEKNSHSAAKSSQA